MPTFRQRYIRILWYHPTAFTEMALGLFVIATRGLMLLLPGQATPTEPAQVFYRMASEETWGIAWVVMGMTQAGIAGSRRWRQRAWVATALACTFALSFLAFCWAGDATRGLPVGGLMVVEMVIAWRCWHDKEVITRAVDRRVS